MITGSYGKNVFSFVNDCLSSKVAVPLCIPTGNELEFHWLRMLPSIWCCQCPGVLPLWYLMVVLFCISLMTCDVEHLFIHLFSICISSLVRCPFRSLIHFLIGWFVFLLLGFESSLYILDNSSL